MKSAQLLQPNSLKPFLRRLLLLGPFLLSLYIPQDAKQTLELSLRLFFRQLAHWQVLKVKGFWRSLLCFLLPSPAKNKEENARSLLLSRLANERVVEKIISEIAPK